MEFSQNTLIQFGLDIAGYLTIGVLLYVLLSRRLSRRDRSDQVEKLPVKPEVKPVPQVVSERGEFVNLPEPKEEKSFKVIETPQSLRLSATKDSTMTRRENRRAIYQEARQLLANGHSRRDVMTRLPLTETELEMLSAAGQA